MHTRIYTTRARWLAAMALCACALQPVPALALTPGQAADAAQASERIQREEQIRRDEQNRRDLERRGKTTTIVVPEPKKTDLPEGNCRDITVIEVKDATHLPQATRETMTKPYEGRCLGVNEIQALLSDITKYYIEKGYAAARAYIPQQDLTSGRLEILVVEGKVSMIRMKGETQRTVNLQGAFPWVVGRPLNLRDIEQGLDQINRLGSNHASMDVLPGDQPGDSVIVINNEPGPLWHFNATADNYGTRGTGRDQVGATVSLDSLLGFNEFYSFTKKKSWPFDGAYSHSDSGNFLFSVPLGYSTLTMGYGTSDYRSTVTSGALAIPLSGDSENEFVTLDHTFFRDQDSRASVSTTLTGKEFNNYAAGQKLTVSSRRLTVLDVSGLYSTTMGGAAVSANLGVSQGLKLFNALDDPYGLPGSAPRAQFTKLTFGASYFRPMQWWQQDVNFTSSLSGQYALDPLYGSEQISIGGIYSVRGFYDSQLANDHGLFLRNDLSWSKPLGSIRGQALTMKPYIALDAGGVRGKQPGIPSGAMLGAAVGLGFFAGPAYFDIYTGHPLAKPGWLQDDGFNTFARLSIGI